MSSKPRNQIHFIGIGGIGMSGLARYYKAQGDAISGSDSAESPITATLRKEGIQVKIGHAKGNIQAEVTFVIYNRAIPADNPELDAARRLGIRIIPYAEALGELTEEYSTIAITGSHGKSTTTALSALALIAGGIDPTVLVGTNLKEFGGKNIRIARTAVARKNGWLVLEADDFGAAFWSYSPAISIVTNIDREHLDFYKNLGGVKKGFFKFLSGTIPGGTLILNHDDKNLFSLKADIAALAKKKELRVIWYSIRNNSSKARLNPTAMEIKKNIKIPGEHNLSNAMAVYELAKLLKISKKKTLTAISTYQCAWRRMEHRGEFVMETEKNSSSMPVYDDYAHHPTEIIATLKGFHEKFPAVPTVCVFQPHQAKRLRALFKEFIRAFQDTDVLILIPSYTVAGRDDIDPRFTAQKLADSIQKKYPRKLVHYLAKPANIKNFLEEKLMSSDNCCYTGCIVMMGAGDIVNYTSSLIA
jgi:UDP-N-acetylmuramate--alanine ligase